MGQFGTDAYLDGSEAFGKVVLTRVPPAFAPSHPVR